MSSVNKVILIGYLGQTPELKMTQTGTKVATLSLATTTTWKDQSGEKQEKTEWHRVMCYGRLAEIVNEYTAKGSRLYVEGSIGYSAYVNKAGETRYSTQITAREIRLLSSRVDYSDDEAVKPRPAPENAVPLSTEQQLAAARDMIQPLSDDNPF